MSFIKYYLDARNGKCFSCLEISKIANFSKLTSNEFDEEPFEEDIRRSKYGPTAVKQLREWLTRNEMNYQQCLDIPETTSKIQCKINLLRQLQNEINTASNNCNRDFMDERDVRDCVTKWNKKREDIDNKIDELNERLNDIRLGNER